MIPWNDSQDEMRGPHLDEGTADRLLAARVHPGDAPPSCAEVARLLLAADAPPTAAELAGEARAVAAAAQAMRSRPTRTAVHATRTSAMRPRFVRAKIAGLVVAGTLVGTTGLAAAGVLPDAAENAASHVLSNVGISVPVVDPTGVQHPASTGSQISQIATTTTATGAAKGALISSIASGGMSQAGQHHGSSAGASGSAPVTTPNTGGTGTADAASGGASDAGTTTADQASHGHSAAGSGNLLASPFAHRRSPPLTATRRSMSAPQATVRPWGSSMSSASI